MNENFFDKSEFLASSCIAQKCFINMSPKTFWGICYYLTPTVHEVGKLLNKKDKKKLQQTFKTAPERNSSTPNSNRKQT